ncbi:MULTISPECIES: AlwI family type II restriction endonuclease [unclassified Clostridium]|uniref:AlwI family type II restriction endonuclease n=1 Tax=unclassified Clostridium TaxID=2614128 RepID=UPI00196A416A|nr:AlwI family type II restriction endonuclease [Clostridium sp. JN-9]
MKIIQTILIIKSLKERVITLLKSRDQWFNEGQPVMRHLRDFESKEQNKENYCLFIAPIIHRDTLNTFWFSIKMGYEGKIQKIIPLSIEQYTKILNIAIEKKNQNSIRINNKHIKNLIDLIYEDSKNYMDCTQWVGNFDNIIEAWSNGL